MLVLEKAKALALKLNNPNRVLDSINTAKTFEVQGVPLVITPHRLDEVKILRNLGIKAPSPILHYYDWPGQYTPFEHQKETAAFLTLNQRGLVLNEIGTGKTQSALWAADYLIKTKQVKKVLIMSPLSTLERVWGDGIFTGLIHRKFVVLHGTAERRLKLLKQDVDFYIVNHDGFPIVAPHIHGMFDLVIVDEAAVLRNPSTQRFKVFRRWIDTNPSTRLWLMTGTPTPNDPTDAWALAKLVNSPFCTKTYTAFREQVMMKIGQWRFVPRPESVEIVKHVLQPAVRYTRDECFDLPETIIQTRHVDLTPIQKKHYQQMLKHFVTEMAEEKITNGGTITAVNEAVKLQKLVQICCGVAYGDDGQHIEVDCSPRVNLVKEIIEEAGHKVIVFVPLTGTLHMLERELEKHWAVGVVNGEVSSSKRNQIFHDFQHSKEPHVLIAHPGTMAHGLTLTTASTIIWYGPSNSNETYVQANGRIERIGKKKVSNVIHIEATELEHKMYERLRNKQKLQGLLLDLIQQETRG
jgi:SNF2 family DNA or RNA helicase